MGSALIYVVVVALVAAVIYLGAALLFGRGEELAPMGPGATPTRLPARDLAGDDVRELRFQQALRGYKMSEVDWAISRLADEVDELRARLEQVEGEGAEDAAEPAAGATANGASGGPAGDPDTDPRGIPASRAGRSRSADPRSTEVRGGERRATDPRATDPRSTDPRAPEVRHGRR